MMHDRIFSTHFYAAGLCPAQGWKLHVSATPWSAPIVLERCLPVLLDYGVGFKVASSRLQVLLLNNGQYGTSQVGKFITVYPSDDAAVRIAVDLDGVTSGLAGPRVPSDRPLRPHSLVHYRYGAFHRPPARPEGEAPDAVGGLRDDQGRWVPDRREFQTDSPPMAIVDPFEASGAHVPAAPRPAPLAGRYLVVDVLATSACGAVYRAIDLDGVPAKACVLKEFSRDAGGDIHGRVAPDWGRREARLLARHNGDPVLPTCRGQFELDGNVFVALDYLSGRSLAAELAAREERLDSFSVEEVVSIGVTTARHLRHVHDLGIVMRDVNPANLILTPDGDCRLVDFGIAYDSQADDGHPNGLGTADFCSPQQWAGGPPQEGDDVFSWGAVMHQLLCGTIGLEASWKAAPGSASGPVPRLPVQQLRPDAPLNLARLIDRSLAWDPSDRTSSFSEVLTALSRVVAPSRSRLPAAHPSDGIGDGDDALETARAVGDALCAAALSRDGGICWATRGDGTTFCGPDLYHGAAGIALFLAELGRSSEDERYQEAAKSAARWLAGPVWASGRAEAGLYCGESGVGWFMLRLADLLGEPGYLRAAELRARRVRGVPHATLDLLSGAAGHALFLCRLGHATHKEEYIEEAHRLGKEILEACRPIPGGGACWPPPRHSDLGRASLGLAHGAAGIALALLELSIAVGDQPMASTAAAVGDLLVTQARPHPDGGWCWPETLDGAQMRLQGQCHGAVGIGQFFVRLAQLHPKADFTQAAEQAALTAHREMARRPSPTLCHGVAGDGMFFLECDGSLDDARYGDWARECGDRLRSFRDERLPGRYLPAAGAGPARPDLLTGDAGVGWFHLGLANPANAADPILGRASSYRRTRG